MNSRFPRKNVIAPVWLAWLFVAVVLPFAAVSPIGSSSEARESHIMQVMVRDSNWLLPTRNGLLPSKPPLHHWIGAGISKIAGRTDEFTTRLPSLFFAALLLWLVINEVRQLARWTGGPSAIQAPWLGLIAATILCSTYGFASLVLDSRVDMTCAFFTTLAVCVVSRGLRGFLTAGGRDRYILSAGRLTFFYLACALAVLAKGPLGLVLPLAVSLAALSWMAGIKAAVAAVLRPTWGWVVFAVVAAPWYIWAIHNWNGPFVERQILFENIARFTGGVRVNTESSWYYLGSFLRSACPWSVLFVVFFAGEVKSRWADRRSRLKQIPVQAAAAALGGAKMCDFYLVWFFTGIVLFSIASGKRQSYLLPLYPALSIYLTFALRAWFLSRGDHEMGRVRALINTAPLLAGVLTLSLVLLLECFKFGPLPLFLQQSLGVLGEEIVWLGAKAASIQGVLLIVVLVQALSLFLGKGADRLRHIAAWLSLTAVIFSSLALGLGVKNHMKGFDRAASKINQHLGSSSRLVVIKRSGDEFFDPLLFYLNRQAELMPPEALDFECHERMRTEEGTAGSALYLARKPVFEAWTGGRGGVEVYDSFTPLGDLARGRLERQFILFGCRGEI